MGFQERGLIVAHNTPPIYRGEDFIDDSNVPRVGQVLLPGDDFDLDAWPDAPLTPDRIEQQLQLGRKIAELEKQGFCGNPFQELDYQGDIYYYSLTEQGGAVWEEAVQADWSKHITWSSYPWPSADLGPNQKRRYGRIGAATLETLETYLDFRLRWDNNVSPEKELKSFYHWKPEPVGFWKTLYWKTLPCGWQCDFTEYVVEQPQEIPSRSQEQQKAIHKAIHKAFWQEHRQLFQWYTEPYKLF